MQRRLFPLIVSVAVMLSLSGVAARATAQPGGSGPAQFARAQALYDDATKDIDAGNYASACPKLEEVVQLAPQGIGARFTLAQCYEGAGKLASAHASFVLAEALAVEGNRRDRQQEARERAEALRPRLASLTITVAEGVRSLAGLKILRDGVLVAAGDWGVAVPVDKGQHSILASANGKLDWGRAIVVSADGVAETVTLDSMVEANVAPPPTQPPVQPMIPKQAPVVVKPPAGRGDAPSAAATSLSHRGQFGAVLRADIDGRRPGVMPAFGLSYGIGDYFEITACGLVGLRKGVEAGATLLLLRGALKPRISVGVPIFFVDGARPGVRASAGLQWDPLRHLGVFVDAGLAAFPNAPAGFDKVVFVPSVGVEPRL